MEPLSYINDAMAHPKTNLLYGIVFNCEVQI